tara:strand:- start:269 stop:439 length:171 start_codon:yes stop_codon:yes gene_type:complete
MISISFVGAFIVRNMLPMVSIYEDQSLLIALFGASTVLLFGLKKVLKLNLNLIIGN